MLTINKSIKKLKEVPSAKMEVQEEVAGDAAALEELVAHYESIIDEDTGISDFIIEFHERILKQLRTLKKMKLQETHNSTRKSEVPFQSILEKVDEVPMTEGEKVETQEIGDPSDLVGEGEEVETVEVKMVQKMPMPKRPQGRRHVAPPPMKK